MRVLLIWSEILGPSWLWTEFGYGLRCPEILNHVQSNPGRFGLGSFRSGSFRPGSFRPNLGVGRFGLGRWVDSALGRFGLGSSRPKRDR